MNDKQPVKKTYIDTFSSLDILFKEKYKKTFKEILLLLNSNIQQLGDFSFIEYDSHFLIIYRDDIEIIFTSSKRVIFKNGFIGGIESQIIDENVISSLQINYIIKEYKIENLLILNKKDEWIKYERQITLSTILLTKIPELTFKSNKHIPKFNVNKFCIANLTKVKKELLSKYFSLYFKYNDKNEEFEFYQTKNRKELSIKIIFFIKSSINFFKITGPSNNGKSITLLYYSRYMQNIVYLNLKILLRPNDRDKMSEIFIYELQRLNLIQSEIDKVSNIFLANREFWNILYLLIIEFKNKKIVFILDQFSQSTVNNEIYQKISDLIKGNPLKLILCSSINDNNIKDEVIKTLSENKGNPTSFTELTQKYYYYFTDLINIENIKEKYNNVNKEIFAQFNFCDKYVNSLEKDPSASQLNSITQKMYDKIDVSFKKGFVDYKYILVNLQNYIKKNIEYKEAELYLKQTPLKYFKLILCENYFQIDYQFPFIKNI